jgi:hypothetical protein
MPDSVQKVGAKNRRTARQPPAKPALGIQQQQQQEQQQQQHHHHQQQQQQQQQQVDGEVRGQPEPQKRPKPDRKHPDTVAVFIGRIPKLARPKDLKDAVTERHVKVVHVVWKGAKGYAFVYLALQAGDSEASLCSKLQVKWALLLLWTATNACVRGQVRPQCGPLTIGPRSGRFGKSHFLGALSKWFSEREYVDKVLKMPNARGPSRQPPAGVRCPPQYQV